jgi:WD40 repeat protein
MIAIAALLFMWKFYEERAKAKELVKESSKEDLATAKQLFDEDQWGRGIAYLGHSLGLDPENSDAAIHFWSAVVYGRHGDGRLPLFWHDLRSASYGVFNPSGTCVLVATDNGSSVRDTVTGETLWSRPGVSAKVGAFSPDGKSLLTVNSSNGLVQIWNLTTNRIPKCTLQGVPETTLSAAFSADSSRIVVTGLDNGGRTAGVWDADGNNICILTNEGLVWIPNAAFSQDGKYVVTASGAGNDARVWDASSGAMLSWLAGAHEHTDWVMAAAFNPDGDMVVTSSNDKTARTWRWRSTNTLRVATNSMAVFPHNGSVVMASFNADGSRLVTASADGSARIWDPANGTRLADPLWHKSRVIAATFSSNAVGAIVVTRCADNTVHVWDARTGSPVGEPLQHGRNNSLYDAVFTGAGQTNLVTCGSQGFGLWNIDPLPPGRLLQHSNKVWSARFSPHGHELVTACNDGITRIWDATSTNEKPRLCLFTKDHEKEIRYAEFNSNGTWVVTAGPGEIARVWNAHTGSLLWTLTGHSKYLKVAKFNSAGTRVVTASIDGSARLFDLGQEPTAPVPLSSTLPALTHEKSVLWACFSPNDQFIITASLDRTARIWNATNGHLEATIIHHDWVLDAQFSQDSRSVATASYDRTVAFLDLTRDGDKEVWNPANCLSLSVPAKAVVVGFSPHGEFLAAGTEDGTVAVWAISELQRGTVPNPKTIHLGDKVNWLEFKDLGSKGLFLATASSHQTACLWRVLSGGQLESYCEPFPHQGDVLQVSYDPNGQYVATASDDKTAGIWMVPPRVAWDESMNSPTGEAAPHFSVGEALTDTIAGFRFDTNTGQIQPMRIEERLDLSKKLERYKFADDHWHNLFLWWEANSKACSTNARQPWPQEP